MGISEQPFPVEPTAEELDRQFGQPHYGHASETVPCPTCEEAKERNKTSAVAVSCAEHCDPETLGICGENVHQHPDGKWFFWDEVQCDEYGPYDTKEECQDKLQLYCDTYLGPAPTPGSVP